MNIIGISGLDNSVAYKKQRLPGLTSRQYRIVQGLDSAAALVTDRGIVAAAAEERFTREKGTNVFPMRAIRFCLETSRLAFADIDYIAHGFSFDTYRTQYTSADSFTREVFANVYRSEALIETLGRVMPTGGWASKLVHVEHHIAHAASAFYPSGFADALILIADGMGEIHSTTVAVGEGNEITVMRQIPALHSLGIFYGVFTYYLGFYMNSDEYKVMGLASYGNSRRYFAQVMSLIHLKSDGGYSIPILFENQTIEERETYAGTLNRLVEMFGPERVPGSEIRDQHKDLAAAVQAALQTTLLHVLRHFKSETHQRRLCIAGGVGLNCSVNGVIKRSKMFDQVFVQPAAGDDGTALGAALYIHKRHNPDGPSFKMSSPLWGPEYGSQEIETALRSHNGCQVQQFSDFNDLTAEVARRLVMGQIVAWFQGRMEFGPRALGSRSILVDPRDPKMRDRLNAIIKKREDFRPFAPAVIAEAATRFFEITPGDEDTYAHMLFVVPVRLEYRAALPAITHVDGSARLQTVSRDANPRFWGLLRAFGDLTGVPVLLNTSFNIQGQPIVCTPAEAMQTFVDTQMDTLVIGDYLVERHPV